MVNMQSREVVMSISHSGEIRTSLGRLLEKAFHSLNIFQFLIIRKNMPMWIVRSASIDDGYGRYHHDFRTRGLVQEVRFCPAIVVENTSSERIGVTMKESIIVGVETFYND